MSSTRFIGLALGLCRTWWLAAACFVAAAPAALAQTSAEWNSIGPAGGTVTSLIAVATNTSTATLFAGTPENGVFVSSDAGATWAAASSGIAASQVGRQTLLTIHALATDGQFLFAATGSGLYTAIASNSPSWVALPSTGSANPLTLLAFDAATRRLFAASAQPDASASPGVYSASIDSTGALASGWAFDTLPASAGSAVTSLSVVPSQGGNGVPGLLVGVGSALFAASIDATSTTLHWINADPSASLAGGSIETLAYSVDFLQAYACSGGVVFYSGNPLDAAPIWTPLSIPSTGASAITCTTFASIPIALGGAPFLLLGTDQGAFVSSDGVSFAATGSLGPGTPAHGFAVSAAAGSNAPALFAASGYGVVKTDLGALAPGAAWSASNGPASVGAGGSNLRLNNANVVDSAIVGNTLFAAAVSNEYVEVFSSPDGGVTWSRTNVASALAAGEEVTSLAADTSHGVLYAATTQGLLAYTTGSGTWAAVGASTLVGRVGAVAVGSSVLFVGTDNGLFVVPLSASPGGAMPVAAGLSGWSVRVLLVDAGSVFVGAIDALDDNYVFSASEASAAAAAAVWAPFGITPTGSQRITSLLRIGGGTLLAATNGNLVLFATAGSAWSSANTSSDAAQQIADTYGAVTSLYSDGTLIYAATRTQGVFVSALGPPFSWAPINGSGSTALPALEVHSLKASGGLVYASTRAGIATLAGLGVGPTPPPVTPPTATPAPADSGGGSFDVWLTLLLAAAALGLRGFAGRRGPRR